MEMTLLAYPKSRQVSVTDPSQPGEARRIAVALARELGFDDVTAGQVEIVVTELGKNLVKHAGGGALLMVGYKDAGSVHLDIMAVDKGKGIANVSTALEDGYSSAGTPGTGLGAVRRMTQDFEVFTQPAGTAILARVGKEPKDLPMSTGSVSVPIAGERECGDAFAAAHTPVRSIYMVVDGLGHGPIAAEAAHAALELFDKYCSDTPADILSRLHDGMRSTRGAAVAIAEIHHARGVVTYSGVGNIAGMVLTLEGKPRNMVSHNGIIGHQASRFSEFTYPWEPTATLLMHSDGLQTHWNMSAYPGLLQKDPALLAAVLHRDFDRKRDDVTVVVARRKERPC